jgi:hypothetical protein
MAAKSCVVGPQPEAAENAEDVEDGIDVTVASLLSERKETLNIRTWDGLWRVLFPSDVEIPSPSASFASSLSTLIYPDRI